MILLTAALLTLALAPPPALAQSPPQQAATDFQAEYKTLERAFKDAQDAYYEPYFKAKTDAEREKIQLDPEKEPTKHFVARFQDLAQRAQGTEAAARAWMWIASNSQESDDVKAAVDELLSRHMDSPLLEQFCSGFQYGAGRKLGADRTQEVLGKLAKDSPHADVRAAALFVSGAMALEGGGSKEEAVAVFERVKKEYPGTAWAREAEGFLFESQHLQIGMVAPDFETADEAGKTWKLSDYRGKVVVIDFWGIW